MAKPESVDAYLAAQPPESRAVLGRVREAIRGALRDATEAISYGIPTYEVDGRAVVYFAGWKEHYSVYPASAAIVAALRSELAPYEVEKGTIRFPLDARVPTRLIARIAKLRAAEAADRSRTKRTTARRKAEPPHKRSG
jgi:uncharacterized protein YdhG (YjbR/CyaY superfamily)